MAIIEIQKGASLLDKGDRATLRLKGCERCGGDVSRGRDWHGDFARCLQCGWYKDEPGDAMSELVSASMRSLMEEMEEYERSQRRTQRRAS